MALTADSSSGTSEQGWAVSKSLSGCSNGVSDGAQHMESLMPAALMHLCSAHRNSVLGSLYEVSSSRLCCSGWAGIPGGKQMMGTENRGVAGLAGATFLEQ